MKKTFAQVLFAIALISLGLVTGFYRSKLAATEEQLIFSQDTIRGMLKAKFLETVPGYEKLMGKREMGLGDSLIEKHRIGWCTSEAMVVILEMKTDSSVKLVYRRAELKSALVFHKSGFKILFEETKTVPRSVLMEFHKKLAAIPFLDAVRDNNPMCCFTTGGLGWEEVYPKNQRLKHSTWCSQSVGFAQACEYVFQFVDDPKLKSWLKSQ